MKRMISIVLAGGLLAGTTAFAEGRVAQRQEQQQQRIAQGVKSGSLTARETAKLETRESKLNGVVRADRKANGGNLTNNEKTQINQQQNKLSNQIFRDKHNGQHQQP